MKIKKVYKYIFIFIFFLLAFELYLRIYWGFCDALLYKHSNEYEYIAKPNQDRFRFRSHIKYNSYSQRSNEPDINKITILGLGDSVLFGGTWMDQDSLATTIVSNNSDYQILNISSGSWGPDNCAAYLEENGIFNAQAMILVCSSHDAYDTMTFKKVVGVYPNYPDKQYFSAIYELINRYLLPYSYKIIKRYKSKFDPDEEILNDSIQKEFIAKKTNVFNPGFERLKKIAESNNIPLYIFLHAEKKEIENKKYNKMGEEIVSWANKNNIKLITGLDNGENISFLKDKIHYNSAGQKFLSEQLFLILNELNK